MSFGKSKHHLTKILRYAHRDADNDAFLATMKIPRIQQNPNLEFTTSSTARYATSGVSTVKGPKSYYTKPSSFSKEAYIPNVNFTIGPFNSHFKLGENHYMDLDKIRIITKIKVHCISHVNSDINYPKLQSSISNTDPPTSKSYAHNIEAYRLNPGGFVGFNIYKISGMQWQNQWSTKIKDFFNNKSLFKSDTFYHSEVPYKADNLSWVLKKHDDLILYPNFDYFHAGNASHVLASRQQAITVSQPYYQYEVDINYFDL